MLSSQGQRASQAIASARTAKENRYRHMYSRKATVGPGDWTVFQGAGVVAEWDVQKKEIGIYHSVNNDGVTPNKSQRVVVTTPPMTGKFVTNLEGTAFVRSKPDAPSPWVTSRARAKYRFSMRPGDTSKELEELWAQECDTPLSEVHLEFAKEVVAAQKKIMRDAWHTPDTALAKYRQEALRAAREMVKLRPEYAPLETPQYAAAIRADPKLKAEIDEIAIQRFINNTKMQCIPATNDEGVELPLIFNVTSKVYAVANYGPNYDSEASGPTEAELPMSLANMPRAISKMANLKGGLDARKHQMIKFALANADPSSPKYHKHYPSITIDGESHPDYSYDPLNKSDHGKSLKSWITLQASPRVIVGPNGVSVGWTLMGDRTVAIFRQEKLVSAPPSQFAPGFASGLYQDSDDEGDDSHTATKRVRTLEPVETVVAEAPQTAADATAAETPQAAASVPAAAAPEETADDMEAIFD